MSEQKSLKKIKVPFEQLNHQVELLFTSGLAENETVDDRLLKIEDFIEVCGWDVDEFEAHRQYGDLN